MGESRRTPAPRPGTPRAGRHGRSSAAAVGRQLAAMGRRFYARNWVLGTSGNFSVVLTREPLELLVTPSAAHKGTLTGTEFLRVDATGRVRGRPVRQPSAETALHVAIVQARAAGAVLHTHSVWGTILSDLHGSQRGLAISGYEMLKGLDGVSTHEHREWIPIIDNDQNMTRLAALVGRCLADEPRAHAFLLRAHGLYTWGATVADAERHVEILEFLLEAVGRREAGHGDRQNP